MSRSCSICTNPKVALINVSLSRDGTRATARAFDVSRPALDRHKRHLAASLQIEPLDTGGQSAEATACPGRTLPSLAALDLLMRECEQALTKAKASKSSSDVIRALKEMRACLELKLKLAPEKPASMSSNADNHQRRGLGEAEMSIRMLQKICLYTKGFNPLRIWQLKILHDMAMNLVQSETPPDEIARQMTLRTREGRDLSLVERLYGIVWGEEWQGQEKEVAKAVVRDIRGGLKKYPTILQHLDDAFAESVDETPATPCPVAYHHVGEFSKPKVINSPYCGPA